jgi:hypothetical protein
MWDDGLAMIARAPAFALIAVALAAPALATGPSQAEVRIVPLAANARGVVLFKTLRLLNRTGAHGPAPVETGWLLVSGRGVWKEVSHADFDPSRVVPSDADARFARIRAEFESDLDWAAPPASLAPLLAEHGFTARDRIRADEGSGAVAWTPRALCAGATCSGPPRAQRTVGGIESARGEGSRVACAFSRAGVALFHNRRGSDGGDPPPRGALFRLPANPYLDRRLGPIDLGYDLEDVDGVVLLDAGAPASRSIPISVAPGSALSDATTPARARALLDAALDPDQAVTLVSGGRAERVGSCRRWLELTRRGWEPPNTLELTAGGLLSIRCHGLALLARARPSRESEVASFTLDARSLSALPPCVGGMWPGRDATAVARQATSERLSWADLEALGVEGARLETVAGAPSSAGTALDFGEADWETTLWILARGDVDGDRREDLLVSSVTFARHGSWRSMKLYVLTRDRGAPVLRVVGEHGQFPAERICFEGPRGG